MKLKCILLFFIAFFTASGAFAGDYVIGEGDGLQVSVWGVNELNFPVKVRPDGKITVPGLGDVAAAGFTPRELTGHLTDKLKALVKNPIVTVTVQEITNSKVYVFGGGVPSGVYDLNRRTTLLQLLCTIGGAQGGDANTSGNSHAVAKACDYRRAYVLRKGVKVKEGFHKLFVDGEIAEDMVIESNDAIFIPQLPDSNIYVLGAVNAVKAIVYREGMTAMEAILEAGGFTRFASQNSVEILRKEAGKDTTIPVRAKDLIQDADLKQNVKLKPGDYVVVKEGMF